MHNDKIRFDTIGLSEDNSMLILECGEITIPLKVDVQNIANVLGLEIPIMKKEDQQWNEINRIKPTKVTLEMLKDTVTIMEKLRAYIKGKEGKNGFPSKEKVDEYYGIVIYSLIKQAELIMARDEYEEMLKQAEEEGKIVVKCPHCGKPNICEEYGEKEVYCGNGVYKYYITCKKCGHHFQMNSR